MTESLTPFIKPQTSMKTFHLKLVQIIFAGLLFGSCMPEEDGIYFEKIAESKFEYSTIELEILDLVNNYRATKNLPQLTKHNFISSVAATHTNYMLQTGVVSHDNFPERNENLVTNENAKKVGENVAYGFSSARGVVNAWIKSDGHRAIIENESYTHFGISTEKNEDGKYFFTHMFIEK